MTERKSIDDAKPEEVREFARVALGLEISDGAHKATVVEKMRVAGYQAEEITIISPVQPRQSRGLGAVFENENGEDCMTILIPEDDDPNSQPFVMVAVNGSPMKIDKGVPQDVPVRFIEALDHAKEKRYPKSKPSEHGLPEGRDVPRFPYQIVA